MRDADRRVGLVHVLPTGARGTVGVDLEIALVDLHVLHLVDQRGDLDEREARVASSRGVEGRDPHQAVDPLLGREQPVCVLAARDERRGLDPGLLAGARLE